MPSRAAKANARTTPANARPAKRAKVVPAADAASSSSAAAGGRAQRQQPNGSSPSSEERRETRERRLWNDLLTSTPVGTKFIKDFSSLGLFEGRVVSFKYPYATVKYEDGDVEDLETRKPEHRVRMLQTSRT